MYYPEDSATGYYITRTAEALASQCNVEVLSAQPTYRARGTRAPEDEVVNNVHIHRCAATTLNKDVLFFRFLNLSTISISLFFNAVMKIRRNDIVLVVTNPPSLPFVAFLACKLRGTKLVLRIEDVYPEAMIAAGILRKSSGAVRMIDRFHRYLYRKVDHILVLGRDMRRLVEGKLQARAEAISIITNWADTDHIMPLEKRENALLGRLGLMDKFVIQYSGNMGRTHDLEILVESARALQANPSIHFLVIGTGAKEPWLRREVREQGLKNVTILPPQPRASLAESLNACDVALVSFVEGMSGVSVPSRMYNILGAGKPIIAIADRDSELAQVVEEARVGWHVRPGDREKAVQVMQEAAAGGHAVLSAMGQRARTLVEREYTQPQVTGKIREVLRRAGLTFTGSAEGGA